MIQVGNKVTLQTGDFKGKTGIVSDFVIKNGREYASVSVDTRVGVRFTSTLRENLVLSEQEGIDLLKVETAKVQVKDQPVKVGTAGIYHGTAGRDKLAFVLVNTATHTPGTRVPALDEDNVHLYVISPAEAKPPVYKYNIPVGTQRGAFTPNA